MRFVTGLCHQEANNENFNTQALLKLQGRKHPSILNQRRLAHSVL